MRILEIGDNELFARAVPAQTEYYWSAIKPRHQVRRALGPLVFLRTLAKLRRGEFDLMVIHAKQYAPWHPRAFLMAIRDWHIRAPLGLFGLFAWRFFHLFHNVPIAVVDLDDSCLVPRHNFFLLDRCVAYFKRELPCDRWLVFCKSGYPNFPGRRFRQLNRHKSRHTKLKPISYSAFELPNETPALEKPIDVFFAGTIDGNSSARLTGRKELRELQAQGLNIDLCEERLDYKSFLQRMSQAWLTWSPGGLGWDCSRHYEAPLAGSVPLMNYPTIERYAPLEDGKHCFFYPVEAGGLSDTIHKALADRGRLREMVQAAAAHVRQHHSHYARAEYVAMTVLGRRLDGTDAAGIRPAPTI